MYDSDTSTGTEEVRANRSITMRESAQIPMRAQAVERPVSLGTETHSTHQNPRVWPRIPYLSRFLKVGRVSAKSHPLRYSSGGGNGDFGPRLELEAPLRSTDSLQKGVPTYDDDQDVFVHFQLRTS